MVASQIVLTRATRFSNPARSRPRTTPTAPMTSAASMNEMLNPRRKLSMLRIDPIVGLTEEAARAWVTATHTSASRCLSAWNEPTGRPN